MHVVSGQEKRTFFRGDWVNGSKAQLPVALVSLVAVFGDDADLEVLQRIARLGDGRAYPSDPATIKKLYRLLFPRSSRALTRGSTGGCHPAEKLELSPR